MSKPGRPLGVGRAAPREGLEGGFSLAKAFGKDNLRAVGRPRDWVDELEAGWRREYPGADLAPLPPLVRLARLAVLIDSLQQDALRPLGLTPADYTVLAALRRVGPPYRSSPSRLYNVLERSSGGMTKMLKRLERRGFIERSADPDDGRGALVALTPAGLAAQERAFEALLTRSHEVLAPLDARARREIDRALRLLLEAFEADHARRRGPTVPAGTLAPRAGAASPAPPPAPTGPAIGRARRRLAP